MIEVYWDLLHSTRIKGSQTTSNLVERGEYTPDYAAYHRIMEQYECNNAIFCSIPAPMYLQDRTE